MGAPSNINEGSVAEDKIIADHIVHRISVLVEVVVSTDQTQSWVTNCLHAASDTDTTVRLKGKVNVVLVIAQAHVHTPILHIDSVQVRQSDKDTSIDIIGTGILHTLLAIILPLCDHRYKLTSIWPPPRTANLAWQVLMTRTASETSPAVWGTITHVGERSARMSL